MTEQVKAVARAYGKYLAFLGSLTAAFTAGAITVYFMALLPVVERFK